MRRKPKPSPSTYGETGYRNHFGGFHRETDLRSYVVLIKVTIKLGWNHWPVFKYGIHTISYRWQHRACDTTDFHHQIYCTIDPYNKRMDDNYRWHYVWTGKR